MKIGRKHFASLLGTTSTLGLLFSADSEKNSPIKAPFKLPLKCFENAWPFRDLLVPICNCDCTENHGLDQYQECVVAMLKMFPECSESEVKRYLIARRWNLQQAAAMLQNSQQWRSLNMPLSFEVAKPVLDQECFFLHGSDLEGDPVVYFRWGLYDSSKAPPTVYALMICHLLEVVFKTSKSSMVTVYADLSIVPNGVNGYADMEFLQSIIKMASDNYPERLKRLIMYPFPWYGMTVWNCVKYFVDHKTQSKLLFVPKGTDQGLPDAITAHIDIASIPAVFGGKYEGPTRNIDSSFLP